MQTGLDYKSRWMMHFYMYIASFKKQITKNPQPFIKRWQNEYELHRVVLKAALYKQHPIRAYKELDSVL